MKKIAVFFGGVSNEWEISVVTGLYVCNLLKTKYHVLPLFLSPDGNMLLCERNGGVSDFASGWSEKFPSVLFVRGGVAPVKKPKRVMRIDCALNCCHGGMGEDGTLSAILRWYQIPSASPNVAISSAFMDKISSKYFARGLNIPVLPFIVAEEGDGEEKLLRDAEELGYPVVVKPSMLGSSIGITVAREGEELKRALSVAFSLDRRAIVEKYLPNKRDLNLAVYQREGNLTFSPVEEVFSTQEILSFGEKYEGTGRRNSRIPAELDGETVQKMRGWLQSLYVAFDCKGVVRADFLLSGEEVYFNELNVVPGSLSTYLFGNCLREDVAFLQSLVAEGENMRAEKKILTSGILTSPVFSGTKTCKRQKNEV